MIYKTGIVKGKEFRENRDGSTYTITGTLTNEDGVVSGFSASNYITLPLLANPVTSYEICMKFYMVNFNDGRVFGNSQTNVHTPQLEAPSGSETKMWFGHPSGSYGWQGTNPNFTVSKNTWYWFKAIYDGAKVSIYMSAHGGDWVQCGTITTNTCGWNQALELGYDSDTGAFAGNFIDLKECYIKINGEIAWSGMDAYLQNGRAKIGKNFVTSNNFYEI